MLKNASREPSYHSPIICFKKSTLNREFVHVWLWKFASLCHIGVSFFFSAQWSYTNHFCQIYLLRANGKPLSANIIHHHISTDFACTVTGAHLWSFYCVFLRLCTEMSQAWSPFHFSFSLSFIVFLPTTIRVSVRVSVRARVWGAWPLTIGAPNFILLNDYCTFVTYGHMFSFCTIFQLAF